MESGVGSDVKQEQGNVLEKLPMYVPVKCGRIMTGPMDLPATTGAVRVSVGCLGELHKVQLTPLC